MDISISYYTAVGKRQNNEDAVSIQENNSGLLAIVADGLGGHAKGEVASNLATATINHMLQNTKPDDTSLMDAIHQASVEINQKAQQMRTTVAALWVGDHLTIAANVGDSRIYQFRNGEIIFQTLDHSVAQMAVLVGEIDKDEIRHSQDRNKLIRVLGDEKPPKVDCEILTVQKGDRFLICSDGFWEPVTEDVMLSTLEQTDTAKQWLELMRENVEAADHPYQDNHTAIALIIED